jgi:Alginate lyase
MINRRPTSAALLAACALIPACSGGKAASDSSAVSSDGGGGGAGGPFRHPGILVNLDQLELVKSKIASATDPWNSAFAATVGTSYASSTYTPQPIADVDCGPDSNPDIGCSAEMSDAIAAYTQALLWVFTGTPSYAQKAIQIMNAWSSVLTEHTNSNAPLQAAWVGSIFPRAAEIIRWTNAGWTPADVSQFEAMLKNVYLPEVVNGAPKENGNWELSMIEASISIGVFLDDQTTFDNAVALWRQRVPAYVYLTTDGPTPVPPPGGDYQTPAELQSFWYDPSSYVDGLSQETCRDLGHVQYGLAAMVHAAETARIQGVDLYSEQAARITAGFELHAQYLDTGGASSPCSGALAAVTPDPTWEIGYNEYANRLSESLPHTEALLVTIRPTLADHHMDWETLTHAEVGSVGLP